LFLYKAIFWLIAFIIRLKIADVQGPKIPSKSLNLSLMKYMLFTLLTSCPFKSYPQINEYD